MESRSLARLCLYFLQKRAGARSRVCRARMGKRGDRMLARRATVNRAAWNARSWDPARQVGEICHNQRNLLTLWEFSDCNKKFTNDKGILYVAGKVGNYAYSKYNFHGGLFFFHERHKFSSRNIFELVCMLLFLRDVLHCPVQLTHINGEQFA